jgi:hypothetical protein
VKYNLVDAMMLNEVQRLNRQSDEQQSVIAELQAQLKAEAAHRSDVEKRLKAIEAKLGR